MEFSPEAETPKPPTLTRMARRVVAELHFAKEQLSTADLNPHEGRLRDSLMDVKYMDIPDAPPIHDDTL